MKYRSTRFLTFFLVCASLVAAQDYGGSAAQAVVAVRRAPDPAPADVLFYFNGEACSSSPCTHTYTLDATKEHPSDATDGSNSAIQVNTASALHGSYGIDQGAGIERFVFTITSEDIVPNDKGRIGMQIDLAATADSGYRFLVIDGTVDVWLRTISGGDDLEISWQDGSAEGCGTGTWAGFTTTGGSNSDGEFFIEFAYDTTAGAGSDRLDVYVDGVSRGSSCGAAFTLDALAGGSLYIGGNLAATGTIYMDNIAISNDPDRDLYALICDSTSPCVGKTYDGL